MSLIRFSRLLTYSWEMTIDEIRRENLRHLLRDYKTLVAIAEASGVSENWLSQIINAAPSKDGKPSAMGTRTARALEKGMGKPVGWMDVDHDQNVIHETVHIVNLPKDQAELLQLYRSASVRKRQALLAVARLQEAE